MERISWENIDDLIVKRYEGGEVSKTISESLDIGHSTLKKRLKKLGAIRLKVPTYCVNCGLELTRKSQKKFCGNRCAGLFNNRNPSIKIEESRRKLQGSCDKCGKTISKTRMFCGKKCQGITALDDWDFVRLGDTKKSETNRSRYPYIHALARIKYIRSGSPMQCKICGYDKHVDIAHIRAVKTFNDDTLVSEVNDLNNLMALCKNHHWEFDHDDLDI